MMEHIFCLELLVNGQCYRVIRVGHSGGRWTATHTSSSSSARSVFVVFVALLCLAILIVLHVVRVVIGWGDTLTPRKNESIVNMSMLS